MLNKKVWAFTIVPVSCPEGFQPFWSHVSTNLGFNGPLRDEPPAVCGCFFFSFFFSDRCQVTNSGTIKTLGGEGGADSLITRTHAGTHIAPTWERIAQTSFLATAG